MPAARPADRHAAVVRRRGDREGRGGADEPRQILDLAQPRDGAEAVEPQQRVRQLLHARMRVGIGVAVDVAFDPARDDLGAAVVALGVGDQGRNQQRLALHLAQHGVSPVCAAQKRTVVRFETPHHA